MNNSFNLDSLNFERNFDAILYIKSGKYPYVNEYDQFHDIFFELCGLRASAGSVVITSPSSYDRSAVFVDGRYKLAAKIALDPEKFEICDNDLASISQWIKRKLKAGDRLAYDPRFFSIQTLAGLRERLDTYSFTAVNLEKMLGIQPEKKLLNIHSLCSNSTQYDDKHSDNAKKKLASITESIHKNNLEAYLLCDPCSISWILDIRDFSIPFSPVIFGYLLVQKNGETSLYLDDMYNESQDFSKIKENGIVGTIKFEKDLANDLMPYFCGENQSTDNNSGAPSTTLKHKILDTFGLDRFFSNSQKIVTITLPKLGIDAFETPSHIIPPSLPENCFKHVNNPCIAVKAIKTKAEIAGMKQAALDDSKAITKVLEWVIKEKQKLANLDITEMDVAKKLSEFRSQNPDCKGESFACISAADEHSAIIHYSPTEESNATIRHLLLLDTGGQYLYGTTDITRTIWIGNEEPPADLKIFYTAVLRGHIAIARAKFPEGTSFSELEPLARQFLWRKSADYPHSTGHGIGYVSCVHEGLGPLNQQKEKRKIPLKAGMIVSNEPGYYAEGRFGIRLENMLLVKEACLDIEVRKNGCPGNPDSTLAANKAKEKDADTRRYLEFETISKVPFDTRLIDKSVLTPEEMEWLENYG